MVLQAGYTVSDKFRMSTHTKENTTSVDSSLTAKLASPKMEEQPERSGSRESRDRNYPSAKEERENVMKDSMLVVGEKMRRARYFIIKSLNYDNIQLSVNKGIWATQVMNEPILEEAFNDSHTVILIFSVNSSGFFNGYAQMMSTVGRRRDRVWSQGTGGNNPWGRSFKVKWLRLCELSFHKTLHLRNPLNEYKPVKISRDCQELSTEVGEALCELIDRECEEDPSLTRHYQQSGYSFPEEACNASPHDMSWGMTYMAHPSFAYQYASEASMWHFAQHRSAGEAATKYAPVKDPTRKGHLLNLQDDSKMSYQVDSSRMSSEMSCLPTLTEDEFLEMTYEEYLEAHNRSTNQLLQRAGGQQRKKEDSSSKENDNDDLYSNSDHVSSCKTPLH